MARQLGADHVVDFKKTNPVEEVNRLTGGVDVAIEALGTQATFESALRRLRALLEAQVPSRATRVADRA